VILRWSVSPDGPEDMKITKQLSPASFYRKLVPKISNGGDKAGLKGRAIAS